MADNKLTDLVIRRLKPGPKIRKYADGHGLCLVVSPQGGRWWEHRYRFQGRPRVLSLGQYPVISLAEAREKHLAARKLLANGVDPAAEKKTRKLAEKAATFTFSDAAAAYMDARQAEGWGYKSHWGSMKKYVFPVLGARPIGEITAPEILATLMAIKRLGIQETAKRCRIYISQVFQYAIVKGWVDRNPAADLQGIPELRKTIPVKHQRAVKTPTEFGRLLLDMETICGTLAGKALDLAPYVFVRAGELAGARWAEMDMASSLWRIPGERMKMKGDHLVPLARQVKERIEALRELTGGGPCLFPGRMGGMAPMRPETLRMALIRLGYGPGAMVSHTTHGFKSTASTFLREKGFDPAWIEIQLAHGERNKVVAAYNFADYVPQRREMMQAWADYLDALREGARAGTAPESGPGHAPN